MRSGARLCHRRADLECGFRYRTAALMLHPGTAWPLAYVLTRSFPELLICVPAECRPRVEPRVSMAGSPMAGIGALQPVADDVAYARRCTKAVRRRSIEDRATGCVSYHSMLIGGGVRNP